MSGKNRKILGDFMQKVWNEGDLSLFPTFATEDIVTHDPYSGLVTGHSATQAWISGMQSTFGKGHVRIDDTVEEGDYIACRITHTGVHSEEFLGCEPQGSNVVNAVIGLWKIRGDRICEVWQNWDALGVRRQIEASSGAQAIPDDLVFDPGPTERTDENITATEVLRNKDTVQRWMDGAWNHRNLGLIDMCFDEDMWLWDPSGPVMKGREGFREWANTLDTAFPNRKLTIDHVIGQGNKTAYRVTLQAIHGGDFMGIPATGKHIEASAMVIAIHENGRYKKGYQVFDVLKVLSDIGHA
ncbi:MAG: ester cyclase [Gammaproteobacteria bacterium]